MLEVGRLEKARSSPASDYPVFASIVCDNSDTHVQASRFSVWKFPIRICCTCKRIFVFYKTNLRKHNTQKVIKILFDLFMLYVLGTKYLSAIPTVVSPLVNGELNTAGDTGINPFIFQPVISHCSSWLVSHAPREHSPPCITNVHSLLFPESILFLN